MNNWRNFKWPDSIKYKHGVNSVRSCDSLPGYAHRNFMIEMIAFQNQNMNGMSFKDSFVDAIEMFDKFPRGTVNQKNEIAALKTLYVKANKNFGFPAYPISVSDMIKEK